MSRDPNGPNQNSIGRDEQTAWRERQLREMEQRMRGMSSRDYGSGGGQFIEPVRLADPVNPMLPEELQVLEWATSEIFVSADPAISSPIEQVGPVSIDSQTVEPDHAVGQPESGPEVVDMEPAQLPSSSDSQPVSADPVSYSQPPPQGLLPDSSGVSLWPPGLGRAVNDPGERAEVLREAQERMGGGQPVSLPRSSPSAPEPPQADPRSRPQEGESPPPKPSAGDERAIPSAGVPVPPPRGGDAYLDGGNLPDYGDIGTSFYQDPTASQAGILSAASDAADAIDNHTELIVELLSRLAMNFLRHDARLNELLDKTDAEDDSDEY